MSEPHAEPAADVRSFLPRPGEPVEEYAARLRALHHDLTLVLDAVERGLAAAERAPSLVEARRAPAVVEPHEAEEPHRSPPPPGPLSSPRGSARVEVVSVPAAPAQGGGSGGERTWSGPQEPEGSAPWSGRRAPVGEGVPARGEPAPSPQRSPYAEPWVERPAPPVRREPWIEERGWPPPPPPPAELSFAPPPHAPFAQAPLRRAPTVPPVLIAALVLGWVTVIALILALALGS
jgi:hypothetical protein